MEITRNRIETGRGRATGSSEAVYLDAVAVPSKLEVDDAGNPATWGDRVSDGGVRGGAAARHGNTLREGTGDE
jgi:hypothetical protein